MRLFSSRDERAGSPSSVESSSSKSSMLSLRIWPRKRKRNSPSPSPPLRQDSSISESTSTDSSRASTRCRDRDFGGFRSSQHNHHIATNGYPSPRQDSLVAGRLQFIQQRNTTLPTDQIQGLGQLERDSGSSSNCRPTWHGRRRSSVRLLEILPPHDFTTKELERPLELLPPSCRFFPGSIYRPLPEPGWRVETKARSLESCFITNRPLYSFRHHSPFVTGTPCIIYLEGEIRPGNSEDSVRLALGFVAGRDRASLMPGFERGSIGIHYRNGGLYVNNKLLATAVFKPGRRVGIGMILSNSDYNADQMGDAPPPDASSSSINVEVFLTRDGKKAGGWNLRELRETGSLPFQGLEGNHDLYAAVGTMKEVNVDILLDKRDWKYDPEAV